MNDGREGLLAGWRRALGGGGGGFLHRHHDPPGPESQEMGGMIDTLVDEFQETLKALQASQRQLTTLFHRAQETAGDLESYSRQILSGMTSGLVNLTADGVITLVNPAARQILHLTASSSFLGRRPEEIWGADAPLTRLILEVLAAPGNRARVETRHTAADGAEIWLGLSVSVLRGRAGAVRGITLLMTDLTEVRRLRAELGLRQRLAAMGELTACIAHNFRNSLAGIMGHATLLARRFPADEDGGRHVEAILREVRVMEGGIRQLLEGLRVDPAAAAPVDLAGIVREVLDGLRPELETQRVQLTLELPPGLPSLRGDAGALAQLVANLVHNSMHAMTDGGRLQVKVATDGAGEPPRELALEVSDTGAGIPAEIVRRVFEPFFSTREGGSGLGLALVKGTAERHGGSVELESQPGRGTTVRVRFPVEEASEGEG